MNWLDIVIVIILVISAFLGLKRGFIKTLLPLVGLVLAVFLAGRFYVQLSGRLSFIENPSLARVAAFAIIFFAVIVAVAILSSILRKIIQMLLLGWVDRLGGAVFGFAIGWVVCSVIVALLARYVALPVELPQVPHSEGWLENWREVVKARQFITTLINESALAKLLLRSFPFLLSFLPEELKAVRNFFGG